VRRLRTRCEFGGEINDSDGERSCLKSSINTVRKTLANIFFVLILFPYLSFGLDIPSDSQPWAAIVALTVIVLCQLKTPIGRDIFLLWLFSAFCVLNLAAFLLFSGGGMLAFLRASYKYFGMALIVPAVSLTLPFYSVKVLKFSVFAWFLVTLLQVFYKRPLVSFLLPRASIVFSRNLAIGFAPEPAYLAKMGIFFLILIDLFTLASSIRKVEGLILRLMCIFMVIINLSLTGLSLLIPYAVFKTVVWLVSATKTLLRIIFATVVMISLIFAILFLLGNTTKFLSYLTNLPGKAGAILQGVSQIGVIALYSDPSFLSRYSSFVNAATSFFKGQFFGIGVPKSPRGSIFSPAEESGLYGLILVVFLIVILLRAIWRSKSHYRVLLIEIFLFFVLMSFSESLATSYFPFLVGLSVVLPNLRQNQQSFNNRSRSV